MISDPQTYYPNGTEVYPEEFRIEVYVPPYLNQGFTQPQYTITETDWNYGGQYSISVKLFQGTTSTMKVSLVAGGLIRFPECAYTHSSLMESSHIEHAREHDGRKNNIPRFHLFRNDLRNHRTAQRECFSSGLASTFHPRWTHSFTLTVG